jgi:MoaA/NifB/PqqE/SkfB family radical SAM enzyme
VAGIAGPGDALANFEQTRETFEFIRREDPDITLCLSTNGLLLPRYITELAALGLSHLTVTVNAVDPNLGGKIISFADFDGRHLEGTEAASLLLNNQLEGLRRASEAGLACKVNCVMLKGINEGHIPELIKTVKRHGAALTNIMQLIPVEGSVFEDMPLVSNQELSAMRKACKAILPQMYHCRQCRADAIGPLRQDVSRLYTTSAEGAVGQRRERGKNAPAGESLLFAVTSRDGRLVDQHFGHAEEFRIYVWDDGRVNLKERRPVLQFCRGKESCFDHDEKMLMLAETLEDCAAVISLRIGDTPRRLLESRGIRAYMTYNTVEAAVSAAAEQYRSGETGMFLPVD